MLTPLNIEKVHTKYSHRFNFQPFFKWFVLTSFLGVIAKYVNYKINVIEKAWLETDVGKEYPLVVSWPLF